MTERITPVCFGVACEKHGTCERYHAVDFSEARTLRIGTCGASRPMYLPMFGPMSKGHNQQDKE